VKWIRHHKTAAIVIFVIGFLLILTVVSYLHKGSNSIVGKALNSAIAFVQEPLMSAGTGISNGADGIFRFKSVVEENENLKEENARLRYELAEKSLSLTDLEELRTLSESLNYVEEPLNYKWVSARVIAMDGSNWFNIFTIGVGEKHGIVKDSIVINGQGLIGKIYEVGGSWAKVISVIDTNNHVSFKVARDKSLLGILYGDGKGGLEGYMLSPEASVIKGDLLITSGMEMYPEGIPIGRIEQVSWDTNALLRTVSVEPIVSFDYLSKVSVIIRDEGQSEVQQ
jgi:rod shape-determining protein MreC